MLENFKNSLLSFNYIVYIDLTRVEEGFDCIRKPSLYPIDF